MKKIITFLLMLTCLFVMIGCGTTQQSSESSSPQTSEEPKGDPEFPNNGFKNDNEATYPGAWN